MLSITQDNVDYQDSVGQTGKPAVSISGNNVRYTNTGPVTSNVTGGVGILLSGMANSLVIKGAVWAGTQRDADGVLDGIAIQGSSYNDRIENYNSMRGRVNLGHGDDFFVNSGRFYDVEALNLGDGNDSLVIKDYHSNSYGRHIIGGGAGYDSFALLGDGSFAGNGVTGFESLRVGTSAPGTFVRQSLGLSGFSGFSQILLEDQASLELTRSNNPDASVAFSSGDLALAGSTTVGSVTGSAGTDVLFIEAGSSVLRDVALGDGNDRLTLGAAPLTGSNQGIGGVINAGAGTDTLAFPVADNQVVNLTRVSNFEVLDLSRSSGTAANVTLTHADNLRASSLNKGHLSGGAVDR